MPVRASRSPSLNPKQDVKRASWQEQADIVEPIISHDTEAIFEVGQWGVDWVTGVVCHGSDGVTLVVYYGFYCCDGAGCGFGVVA